MRHVELVRSFPSIGVVGIHDAFAMGQSLNWLVDDGMTELQLSAAGLQILSLDSGESRLRRAILDFVDISLPPWLQMASFGRKRVLRFAEPSVRQVFIEAGLAGETSLDVVRFWDELASRARGLRDHRLLEIGRMGERLSLAYERRRTGKEPTWVSIDSNDDGYDILSVAGPDDLRPLSIEVKTTTRGGHGVLHVTRNEWEMGVSAELHHFHLWDIDSHASRLAILSVDVLGAHCPVDQGDGRWQDTALPVASFASSFVTPDDSQDILCLST